MKTASTSRIRAILAAAGLLLAVSAAEAQLRPLAEDRGAAGLGLKLRKIASGVSVLTITAHPDDEDNALHARLSRGMGARVSLLTLTRGGGGQNEIGPELFDGLRILRTEELLTSHRLDAVDQYLGMVNDFGYSFSVEETLEKWGHEETVGEVVRMIRHLRPDVILTLPLEGEGGGQHHQATGRITLEAFEAAADPERFPEHRELGLRPFQPLKLFMHGVGGGRAPGERVIWTETAIWDPLLGRTYAELGQEARSAHRCQGMGQVRGAPAPGPSALVELRNLVPDASGEGIFSGIPTGIERLRDFVHGDPDAVDATERALADLERAVGGAQWAFSAESPYESISALRAALLSTRRVLEVSSGLDPVSAFEIRHRVAPKETLLEEALALAHGVLLHPVADTGEVVPGGRFGSEVFFQLGGPEPLTVTGITVETAEGWSVEPGSSAAPRGRGRRSEATPVAEADLPVDMEQGDAIRASFTVTAAADAALSRQTFRAVPGRDRFVPTDPSLFGAAAPPAPARVRVDFESDEVPVSITLPVEYRYEGPLVGSEKQKDISVLPLAAVRVTPGIVVFPEGGRSRSLAVRVTYRGTPEASFEVSLNPPSGWEVSPAAIPVRFAGPGEQAVEFEVSVPVGVPDGGYPLHAEARLADGSAVFRETVETIAYHHIQTRHLFRPATALAQVLDATVTPVSVAYVEGVGDEVAEAIEQLGVPLTFLGEEDLAEGDLGRFDVIVLGVRAYLARPDLRTHNQRLLDYVAGGGTLLVQYNKFEFNAGPWAPYPVQVGRGRVTDENAPIRVLAPDHPVFLGPNRIGPEDWDGWVQERGLYFLDPGGDPAYSDLLASEDPFPYNAGEKRGILVEARHGDGRWLYLGLGLWRQLPAGTPGAYRLLANLLSLGHQPAEPTQP